MLSVIGFTPKIARYVEGDGKLLSTWGRRITRRPSAWALSVEAGSLNAASPNWDHLTTRGRLLEETDDEEEDNADVEADEPDAVDDDNGASDTADDDVDDGSGGVDSAVGVADVDCDVDDLYGRLGYDWLELAAVGQVGICARPTDDCAGEGAWDCGVEVLLLLLLYELYADEGQDSPALGRILLGLLLLTKPFITG